MLYYLENTEFAKLDKRGKRKPPTFSIKVWNCFSQVIKGLATTTNNAIKEWHIIVAYNIDNNSKFCIHMFGIL
ncbi:Uncharacterized protein FWK35_00016001 [Aphis craccivora]|uniref:Uncharacterized protein n=1 Tax=Aphis craccivora TaxID=307492 RepID=A0A6G0ZJT3_APHCR|nr:Uncharacterized protein FWK35_00016001 [Aphis craccivora]